MQHDAGSRIFEGPGAAQRARTSERDHQSSAANRLIKSIPVKDGHCYYLQRHV